MLLDKITDIRKGQVCYPPNLCFTVGEEGRLQTCPYQYPDLFLKIHKHVIRNRGNRLQSGLV